MALSKTKQDETARGWQHGVYDVLRAHNVTQFSYVPDAGHIILIDLSIADHDVHSIALTTEEVPPLPVPAPTIPPRIAPVVSLSPPQRTISLIADS